ncbi:uncharacterized protein RAG0_15241 [Rhynchosporium agropyri]|uniref:Uncharacterized protein n=1 Tax=Rhynchosporium agropyri TaxID=914238 RepID=A0A1E1LKB1_9HELO|nr:uncharacterized protein RAG0_15241 [Rhynchosporium agropyri]
MATEALPGNAIPPPAAEAQAQHQALANFDDAQYPPTDNDPPPPYESQPLRRVSKWIINMAATAFAKCFDIFVNVWASGDATIRGGMREGLAWFANTAEKLLVSAIPVAMLFGTTSFWGFRLFAPTFDRILNLLATGLDRILSLVLIVFVITFAFIIWAFLYDPRVDELKVLGLAYLRGFVNNQVQFPPPDQFPQHTIHKHTTRGPSGADSFPE